MLAWKPSIWASSGQFDTGTQHRAPPPDQRSPAEPERRPPPGARLTQRKARPPAGPQNPASNTEEDAMVGPDSLRASDLMTTEVVTVPPATPATAVARLLADRGISAAPVTDAGGRLLGIVTEADLLRRLAGAEDKPAGWLRRLFLDPDRQAEQYARTHGKEAQDVMTRDVVSVDPDATAERCAHLMEERHVKRLPVVDGGGRLVGVVSRADLLRAVLEPPAKLGVEGAPERDARIRAALRKEMRQQQPWAGSLYTFADVENGVVTLHGFVRSDEVRRGLRVLAERIEGVERVEDRMADAPSPLPGGFV
jgi:CBS domain-containing protein